MTEAPLPPPSPAVPPAWLVDLGDRVAEHPQLLASLPTALARLPFGGRSLGTTPAPVPTTTTAPEERSTTPPAEDATWEEHQRWIHAQTRLAVKALFDAGVATESQARPAIHAYLLAAAGQGAPTHATRSSFSANNNNHKRKRVLNADEDGSEFDSDSEYDSESESGGAEPRSTATKGTVTTDSLLPPPTPVSELYVPPPPHDVGALHEGVEAAQLWTQLELRHAPLDGVCDRAVQMDTKDDDDDQVDPTSIPSGPASLSLKPGADGDDDDDDDDDDDSEEEEEEVSDEDLSHLASLSDSQLKAIGFAPKEIAKVRAELRKRGVVPDASLQSEHGELDEEEDLTEDEFGLPSDEEDDDEGFPGASDLSDDEEASRVTYEPLQEEEDQLRRKDRFGVVGAEEGDSDSDSDSESESEPASESESDDELTDDTTHEPTQQGSSTSKQGPSSSSLDDGFFNLESFNRDLLAAEGKEPSTDLDLFTDPSTWNADEQEDEGQDLDELTYESFFAPPLLPSSELKKHKAADHRTSDQPLPINPKGKAKATSSSSSSSEEDDTTSGRGKIRFSDQVQVRRIKRAPGMRAPEPEESIPFMASPPRELQQDAEVESEGDDEASDAENTDGSEDQPDHDHEDLPGSAAQSDEEEQDMDLDEPSGSEEGEGSDDDDGSVEGTAHRVAQDLFADEDQAATVDTSHSTHEKRQAALQAEIAALEAENVSSKDWELGGEASATSRPKDAALEVDMDFVHSLKSAPLATAEHQKEIDELIRRRVLANEWDDVPRRLAIGDPREFLPSKLAQLSDQKSQQSLAELYEQEYTQATTTGEKPTSEADAKLAAEHEELSTLVESVFSQLDRLSNAHYTPRPADVRAGQVTAAPSGGVASMATEQALPQVANGATQQAQEVYDPHSRTGVQGQGGMRVSRSFVGNKNELSASEKKKEHERLRRLKRARNDASSSTQGSQQANGTSANGKAKYQSAKAEKQAALHSLVREPGVAVVGSDGSRNTMVTKRGQLERAKAQSAPEAGKLKL